MKHLNGFNETHTGTDKVTEVKSTFTTAASITSKIQKDVWEVQIFVSPVVRSKY